MRDNVFIEVRERGKLVTRRQGHNIWTDSGREYLASLISLSSFGPDTPEQDFRIKSIGFGIGGVGQTNLAAANSAPLSTAYPVGSDPNATTGNEYDDAYPIQPVIATLERPVRFSGGTNPYGSAPSTDVWRKNLEFSTHVYNDIEHVAFKFFTGPASSTGEFIYGSFTVMPISEAGLFHGGYTADGTPFATLVAYHTFDTINVTSEIELSLSWVANF